jgi:peptidyl-prolyl cis-trans isomerase D
VQHILIKADSAAPKEVKEIAQKKAESILAQLKGGASFNKLAFENTDDPGSKADSGFYGPKPKGIWMPSFDKVLWSLKPGEMSGIVTTPYGYHIIRRPTAAESARFWRDSLSRAVAEPIITAYFAELAKTNDMKIDANAIPHMRAALNEMESHYTDNTALATYKGGSFTTGDFVRWIGAALSDPSRAADQEDKLKTTPNSEYKKMVTVMSQQSMVLNEAKTHGVHLSADEWKAMRQDFMTGIDTLKAAMGLTGPDFDPKVSASARSKAAAAKVDEYFNDLVVQKKQLQVLPGILAATLRERDKTKFNAIALQHGLDLAKAKHSADSVAAAATGKPGGIAPEAAPLPQGALQPAPGGPPTGAPATPPPAPKKP